MPKQQIAYFGRNNQANNAIPINPGFELVLRVQLTRKVAAEDNHGLPLTVTVETQRIVPDPGGYPVTAAISDPDTTYFEAGSSPSNIQVGVGDDTGTTRLIVVRGMPTQNGSPVQFPDDLLFTAYIGDLATGPRRSHIVTVVPVGTAASGSDKN